MSDSPPSTPGSIGSASTRPWEPAATPFPPWVPPAPPRERVWLHAGLFALTLATTTTVGAQAYGSFASSLGQRPLRLTAWQLLPAGFWFSVPALLILFAHEMGHYLACRYYRIRASLPYFLPFPPVIPVPGVGLVALNPFGTFGAVIRIREPIRRKRMLFDIGIAGPLAGLAVALPALVLGVMWSPVVPLPPKLAFYNLGEPLAFQLATYWLLGPVAKGYVVNTHPTLFAAWFGLFLTGLNLIPAGQLDGGHVAYGCLGPRAQWLTYLSCLVALVLGLTISPNWLVWLGLLFVLLFLFGWRHPPVVDEDAPLGTTRWLLAILAIIVLVMCFIPVPIEFIVPK